MRFFTALMMNLFQIQGDVGLLHMQMQVKFAIDKQYIFLNPTVHKGDLI